MVQGELSPGAAPWTHDNKAREEDFRQAGLRFYFVEQTIRGRRLVAAAFQRRDGPTDLRKKSPARKIDRKKEPASGVNAKNGEDGNALSVLWIRRPEAEPKEKG